MSKLKEEPLDLDSILAELGSFGRYQMMTYVFIQLPIMFSAIFASQYIFAAGAVDYRCIVPECESIDTTEFNPGAWGEWALPSDGRCDRLVSLDGSCTASSFSPNVTQPCTAWVYESDHTIVAEFGLACQEWKRTLVGTVHNAGVIAALAITALVSDTFGRKTAFICTAVSSGVVGIIRAFVNSYSVYLFLEFMDATVGAGVYSTGFILALEMVGLKRRVLGGNIISSTFATGQVVVALVAWAFPYWRHLTLVVYSPVLLFILYYFVVEESVRWLLSKGRKKEAAKIIFKAAAINKKKLSPASIKMLTEEPEPEKRTSGALETSENEPSQPTVFMQVIKSKTLVARVFIVSFWWITLTFIYYGLSINSVTLAGNMYVNFILTSLVEIPGYFLSFLTLDRFGRKTSIITAFFICGIALIALPFVPPELNWLQITLNMVGKLTISMAFSSIYIYTSELFPTEARHSLLGVCSMFGRVGSLLAPQTPLLMEYMEALPYLIFGVMAACSGLLMLLTPETLRIRLPDTVAQIIHLIPLNGIESLLLGSLARGPPRTTRPRNKMADSRKSSTVEDGGSRKGSVADRKPSTGRKGSVAPPKALDLDDVLVNELGQFGRFQLYNILLVAVPIIMSAFMSEYIFSAAAIPHRCRISECGETTKDHPFEPEWVMGAIPAVQGGGFASCERYVATPGASGSLDYCPAYLFLNNTVECDGFVYDRDNSVVYDFDLGCQEWLRALAGTLSSVGTLIVLPFIGFISDRFGRRVALVISVFNLALIGLIRAFSVNYGMYLALQILQTTLGAGTFSSSYIFAAELVGPKYRVVTSAFSSSMFAVGQVILGGVAWVVQPWRYMIMALHIPCFLIIAYYWLLSESVRWLISKQKWQEAKEVLEKVARVNKKQISEKSMEALMNPPPPSTEVVPNMFSTIFKSRVLLRRLCTTPIWWITTTFVYYGLSINSTSLSDTMYLNYILTCAIEIPGFFTAVLVLNRIGRKATLSIGFFFSAACNIAFAFIENDLTTLRLVLFLLGKFGISVVFTSLYLFTSELYPTQYRHSLLAFSSMIGRIGSITAPLTPVLNDYYDGLPSIMFGAMGALSGLLVLTQPETLGTKMPDTLAEAEALGTPQSKIVQDS